MRTTISSKLKEKESKTTWSIEKKRKPSSAPEEGEARFRRGRNAAGFGLSGGEGGKERSANRKDWKKPLSEEGGGRVTLLSFHKGKGSCSILSN